MGQELQVPAAFKPGGMSQAFAATLNAQDDNLASGIGQSYGVIGYKGKVWSGRYRGERRNFLRPDDGTPASYLDVIILGQAATKSKSYYKKFDPNQSEGDRPICSSMDSITPDADVTQKQCDTCTLCPRNVWKTDPQTGRKGRECTDYKRLAVLVLPTQSKPTFGQAIMEAMFLRVPPDSLNSLAIMGETMSQQGYHYASYITRITFDPQKAHPCMVFRPLQPLSDAEASLILEMRGDPIVGRITGGDVVTGGMKQVASVPPSTVAAGLVAPAQTMPSTPPTPVQPTPPPQQAAPTLPQTVSTGLGEPPAPTSAVATTVVLPVTASPPSAVQPPPEAPSTGVATGLGGVNGASVSPPPSDTPTGLGLQTAAVADAGTPEESDADMDAKIASFLTPKS